MPTLALAVFLETIATFKGASSNSIYNDEAPKREIGKALLLKDPNKAEGKQKFISSKGPSAAAGSAAPRAT